jgi:hypothetical protein
LITILVWNLKAKIIDIETALLYGDFDQIIFMEILIFMEVGNGKYLVLKKIIYGLVQNAREFYVKFVKALKSCGFTGSLVVSCLWVKQSNSGEVMIAIYV